MYDILLVRHCNYSSIVALCGELRGKGGMVYLRCNKKDGYRQQNVRQRQKLISIIDYE